MPSFPGFLFPPLTSAFPLPVTSTVQHQLLMKALTVKPASLGRAEPLETGEIYSGKYAITSQVKQETSGNQSEEDEGSPGDALTCHVCLKQFDSSMDLKSHVMSEHKDSSSSPGISPYKLIPPVRKLSTDTPLSQANILQNLQNQKDSGSDSYGGSNMCGTCGKSFRDPQSLKFHRYNHVLRYQCNYCGKRFSRSWNLHRHRKTHYRQLQEAGLGSEEPIDVDAESGSGSHMAGTPTYEVDKDLIMTSPYLDYRNHRHDVMPFAFDLRKSGNTSASLGLDMSGPDRPSTIQSDKDGESEQTSPASDPDRDKHGDD